MQMYMFPNTKLNVRAKDIQFPLSAEIAYKLVLAEEFASQHKLASINGVYLGLGLNFTLIRASSVLKSGIAGIDYNLYINPKLSSILDSEYVSTKEHSHIFAKDVKFKVKRFQDIRVQYQNIKGDEFEEEFTEIDAAIMQQEIDALNGITLIDRALIDETIMTKDIPYLLEWEDFIANRGPEKFFPVTAIEESAKDDKE